MNKVHGQLLKEAILAYLESPESTKDNYKVLLSTINDLINGFWDNDKDMPFEIYSYIKDNKYFSQSVVNEFLDLHGYQIGKTSGQIISIIQDIEELLGRRNG